MSVNYNDEQELINIEQQIKQAEAQGQPIEKFVLREIEILQQTIDTFVNKMSKEGRLEDAQIASIEIRQYAAMKQLAQKINLPYEQYDKHIKAIQCRIFGEENWETFFGNK